MTRITLIYGSMAGLVVAVTNQLAILLMPDLYMSSTVIGYATMVVALSFLVVAVKRYRDQKPAPQISFLEGLRVGFGVAALASLWYTVVWELHLYATDFAFMEKYSQMQLDSILAQGGTEAQLNEARSNMAAFKELYGNFFVRTGITFMEMFPVGALVTLVAAFCFRKPNFWPRKTV